MSFSCANLIFILNFVRSAPQTAAGPRRCKRVNTKSKIKTIMMKSVLPTAKTILAFMQKMNFAAVLSS